MKKIVISILIALLFFGGATLIVSQTQALLIGVVALMVALWSSEALALGVVSLLPIVLFPALGILTTKATSVNYAHPIIYLFLGGFLLAIGVQKSHLHLYIAEVVLRFFPNTARGIIFSLALSSGLLSAILSNTTTTLLLMPIALFLTQEAALKMRFALAIAYGATIGGIMTPIGTPPNLIFMGLVEDKALESIAFFQWIYMVLPVAVIMFIVMGMLLGLGVKNRILELEITKAPLDLAQKKVLYLLLALIVVLFVNAPIKPYWEGLGMSEPAIILTAGLLLFLPQFNILEWEEDTKKVPFAIMFLFGAGFSIAKAFASTGLADVIAHQLLNITHLDMIALIVIIAVVITFTTEITSNTALISIMLPIIYSVAEQKGMDARLFMMVATICASYAFMLPIATAPNAIAMSSGVVHIKQMAKYGFVLNIAGITTVVIVADFFWRNVF